MTLEKPDNDVLEQRFWAKVNKDGPVPAHRPELGPCWLWTGALSGWGHGQMKVSKVQRDGAHRVAYRLLVGDFDSALCVLHKCDNPACVNPAHLFLGTMSDNMRDCARKGRLPQQQHPADRHSTKLTAEQVMLARTDLRHVETGHLAEQWGVDKATLRRARYGHTWKHLPMPEGRP